MTTDPIGNALTIIRNAYLARQRSTQIPAAKFNLKLAQILVSRGFLEDVRLASDKTKINLKLKYLNQKPALTGLKRISKPGCRIYETAKKIPKVLSGFGISIISTSQGLLTNNEARQKNLGGEIICEVY
jgi:small subunit ribosomal protein S8